MVEYESDCHSSEFRTFWDESDYPEKPFAYITKRDVPFAVGDILEAP